MSFRYNLLSYKGEFCTISLASHGLSQLMFDNGVRIIKHDLSFKECKAAFLELDGDLEYLRFVDDFQNAVLGGSEKESGRAWLSPNAPNRFDERFEGITPMMQYANRHKI